MLCIDEHFVVIAVSEREAVGARDPIRVLPPLRLAGCGLLIRDHLVVLPALQVVPHLPSEEMAAVGRRHFALEGGRGDPGEPAFRGDEGGELGAGTEQVGHARQGAGGASDDFDFGG